MMKLNVASRYAIAAILLAALVWLIASPPAAVRPAPALVRFALPTQISSGAIFLAAHHGLFQEQNLDVRPLPFRLGKQALAAVVEGKADLALVADTPFVLSALGGEKIAIAAQIFASRGSIALLVRTDRGIYAAGDLRGKRVGTTKGINAEYFLDALLTSHRLTPADLTVVALPPDELPRAMHSGMVDAATLWFPDLGLVQDQLGPKVKSMDGKDVFVYRMLLVGKTDYLEAHGAEVARVLSALDGATTMIHRQPEAARALIASALGVESHTLMPYFEPSDFQLCLDQSLLLALDHQARWAGAKGLLRAGSAPDYQALLRPAALRAVLPHAVRIVY